jgi:hypothetical protein
MTSRLRIGSLWGIPFFIDYTWFRRPSCWCSPTGC